MGDLETLANVAQSLQQGKAPRGRKSIRETIRECQRVGRYSDAVYGSQLLAELELRHGHLDRALTAARSALRLCRKYKLDLAQQDCVLNQLARICTYARDEKRALAYAEERIQRAEARNYLPGVIGGMMQAVLARWQAGERSAALEMAEQAVYLADVPPEPAAHVQLRLATMLLAVGCPTAASDMATEVYRQELPDDLLIRALLVRGAAGMCLGRVDAAARDFRRARTLARKVADTRLQVETSAALALAEARRAAARAVGEDAAEVEKAQTLSQRAQSLMQRAERLAERLRDPRLSARVEAIKQLTDAATAGAAVSSLPTTRKEAAGALVTLAEQTHSLLLAEACSKEVLRMASLAEDEQPYHCVFELIDLVEL